MDGARLSHSRGSQHLPRLYQDRRRLALAQWRRTMRQTIIYELAHVYETESGEDEEKRLGSYSSRENALAAIERYKKLSGFCRLPDAFVIYETTLDHDAAWTDGFFTAYPYFAV